MKTWYSFQFDNVYYWFNLEILKSKQRESKLQKFFGHFRRQAKKESKHDQTFNLFSELRWRTFVKPIFYLPTMKYAEFEVLERLNFQLQIEPVVHPVQYQNKCVEKCQSHDEDSNSRWTKLFSHGDKEGENVACTAKEHDDHIYDHKQPGSQIPEIGVWIFRLITRGGDVTVIPCHVFMSSEIAQREVARSIRSVHLGSVTLDIQRVFVSLWKETLNIYANL